MQKVVSINLNDNAYQLEEQGYDSLRAYLERAEAQLQGNPDRAEILADIEQAIAEKCARYLNPRKTVVSAAEVATIIAEMGPVENAQTQGDAGAPGASGDGARVPGNAPKRLYQIREGAMLTGVCKGIAAYFDVDVTLIRIIFVVLAFATFGAALLAYAALAFIIPYADTTEQHAAAYGLSASAQAFVEQAKRHHESFRARHQWRRDWKRERRAWSRQWRHHYYRQMDAQARAAAAQVPPVPPLGYGAHAVLGVTTPIFAVAHAAVFVAWAYALLSLLTTGTIFGWQIPIDIPLWGSILILIVLYGILSAPLRAMRHIGYESHYAHQYAPFGALHGILWIGFTALFAWLAYRHIPQAHALIESLPGAWHRAGTFNVETFLHLPGLSNLTARR